MLTHQGWYIVLIYAAFTRNPKDMLCNLHITCTAYMYMYLVSKYYTSDSEPSHNFLQYIISIQVTLCPSELKSPLENFFTPQVAILIRALFYIILQVMNKNKNYRNGWQYIQLFKGNLHITFKAYLYIAPTYTSDSAPSHDFLQCIISKQVTLRASWKISLLYPRHLC